MKRKYIEKLKHYIKDGRPLKMKRLTKKHRIDLTDIKLKKKQQSLLHYCCKHGNLVILRYLLDSGLDPSLPDIDGNIPLHLSLKTAIKKPQLNTVYSELILPQIEEFPELLERKNNDGTSCRAYLDRLVELQQPTYVQQNEYENDSDEDWARKLAEEFNYEYEESVGYKEQELGEDDYYGGETHDEWADRMSKEFHRKRQFNYSKHIHESQSKGEPSEKTKGSEEKEKLEREREEMRLRYEHHQKIAKEQRLVKKRLEYEEEFKQLYSKKHTNEIGYDDIPWPFKDSVKEVSMLLFCGDNLKNISNKTFYRKYLKEQKIRWHPDKFLQKLGSVLKQTDKEQILNKVKIISQEINRLCEEFQ